MRPAPTAGRLLGITTSLASVGITGPLHADDIADAAIVAYEELTRTYDVMLYAGNDDGAALGWGAGTLMRGLTGMYEGSGDLESLWRALDYAEQGFAVRSDRLDPPRADEWRGELVKAWTTNLYSAGFDNNNDGQDDHYAWAVHAGNFMKSAARTAYLIRKDPELYAAWGDRADALMGEVATVLTEFERLDWVQVDNDSGYFKNSINLIGEPLPFNMQHVMATTYSNMYLATGDDAYKDKAQDMIRWFKPQITEFNETDGTKLATWNYASYTPNRTEDISHGGLTIEFVMAAHRAGLGFSEDDIERFINVMQLMEAGENGYTGLIDGTGDFDLSHVAYYWLPLAEINPALRETYFDWYEDNYTTQPVLQMVSAAGLLIETGRDFEIEAPVVAPPTANPVFHQRFDQPGRPSDWFDLVGPTYHTEVNANFGDGVVITDLTSSASGNFWAEYRLLRPINAEGEFNLKVDIDWSSSGDELSRLVLRLWEQGANPETDDALAEIGFADFTTKLGRIIAELMEDDYDSGENSLGQDGSATLTALRDANGVLELWWDDQLILSGVFEGEIGFIELAFGNRQGFDFGELGVSSVRYVPEPDAALIAIGLMGLGYGRTLSRKQAIDTHGGSDIV